jgi:hypothetical protein
MMRDGSPGSVVAIVAIEPQREIARATLGDAPAQRTPPGPVAAAAAAAAAASARRTAAAKSVWAHFRARKAVAPPSADEVARMVAEFHARGGTVTVCRAAHLLPIQNGAGADAQRWTC